MGTCECRETLCSSTDTLADSMDPVTVIDPLLRFSCHRTYVRDISTPCVPPDTAFPGGAYGSMPMFFPQPGYAQQSWPVMQSMPVQVPVAMPPTIQAQQAASLPGQLQLQSSAAPQGATVQGNLIQPYPTYGFVVPQTITEQQQVQTTQVPQDDGEPDLEEAKMTMLARYYKNPIYGLKANLARLKAEKKAKENRAAAERKALLDQKQYLQDAMGDFEKE